jgi:hypothetical protein
MKVFFSDFGRTLRVARARTKFDASLDCLPLETKASAALLAHILLVEADCRIMAIAGRWTSIDRTDHRTGRAAA